ncbi:cyanophycin synthetase [Phosphitispora sp. TUW77]|uniref:cyanophycin synthetase n=1 Tax=Phosphitispora sp. TUW77 TaxID=3152361 RepID=UPI003AB4A43D
MEIIEIKVLEGANIYCSSPVIKTKIDLGEYREFTTEKNPGFVEKLQVQLPSLSEHYCSKGKPGGFIDRLKAGTYLGHVIEHVSLELQYLAGMDVIYGKTICAETPGMYYLITEFESQEGAIRAVRAAVMIVDTLLKNKFIDVAAEVTAVREAADRTSLGPSTAAVVREAVKRGIPVMRLGEGSVLQLGYGKNQQKVVATITGQTRCVGVDIASDKVLVKHLLAESGIPVPWGGVAQNELQAFEIARKINDAVVVKPFDGNQGKGVALNLTKREEIAGAMEAALKISPKAIIEKHIKGKHYRLVVVGNRVVAAAERIPAFVVGDGQSTVKQLVNLVNMDPMRGENHEKPLTKIKIDPIVIMVLAKKGLSPNSVPREGEIVYLRENANISTGGIAVDATGRVHSDTLQMVLRAVRLVGLDVAGVDLVVREIDQPLLPDNGALIEVNAAPGIRMHHYPAKGPVRNVAGAIVEMLFPPGSQSRMPIISVTGTNGKTTVTRMVSHILRGTGQVVGTTTSDGIYINGRKIVSGDTTGPQSARVILRDPSVEVAVLETARGGILGAGLGYDYSDVGIITNVHNDHLGLDGIETMEDMAMVKSVVTENIFKKGTAVLNADDIYVSAIADRVRSRIIFFSAATDNFIVRRHLGAGGTAVFVKNGFMVKAVGDKIEKILPVKHISSTLGGIIKHNLFNALAAAAGCTALGLDTKSIRNGLLSFKSDEICNPGRFNVFDIGQFRVVVDYGHNIDGFLNTLQTVKKLNPERVIGIVGMPGDRRNADIMEAGKIIAQYCDEIIIKEDKDLRGRKAGEVAALMRQAVLKAGLKADRVTVCLSETAAVENMLGRACKGDIIVVFYEKFAPIQELVRTVSEKLKPSIKDDKGRKVVC